MADVVSLAGKPVEATNGNVVVAEVVERLEELLAQARAGEVRAFGIAIVRPDHHTSTMFAIGPAEMVSHQLMAAVTYLQHRYAAHRVGSAEEA